MIVVCPSCKARFQYDDARFQGAPVKRFRCPKCQFVFEVPNPAYTVPVPGVPEAPIPTVPAPLPSSGMFQAPSFPSVPAPDMTEAAALNAVKDTTARRDRDGMLTAAGLGSAMPPGFRFSLAFLNGPKASTVAVLQQIQTVIGREEGEIITQDPECSRRHARIDIRSDGTAWLTDLGSTNGTFVDNIRVFAQVQLTDRQEFTCGNSSFMMIIRREDPHGMM